jgi:hypothetical protein
MALNTENLRTLADTLRAGTYRDLGVAFDINTAIGELDEPRGNCGTAACIAGLACILFDPDNVTKEEVGGAVVYEWKDDSFEGWNPNDRLYKTAARKLGLRPSQVEPLFFPFAVYDIEAEQITAKAAATALDKLIETGEVDWSHV